MNIQQALQNIHMLPLEQQQELLDLIEELEQAEKKQKARNNFMDFVHAMWPGFIGGRHHAIMANAFERILDGSLKRLIVNMPPRHRLALNTPVFTTEGWKTIETVQVGDFVFDPDGRPVRVTGKSPVFFEDIYTVTTNDGHVIECDGKHLWTVDTLGEKHTGFHWKTLATKDIKRPMRGGPWLPRHESLQLPERDLPIDPYLLGVWLGDGTKYGAAVGCATRDEPEMRRLIESCGYKTSDRDGYQMFGVLGLHKALRENNLLCNKHIPEEYFLSSTEQRTALLQGLIDTDGSVGKTGRVTFHQTNRHLTEQVCSLINSLGISARITARQTSYNGTPSQPSFRINFRYAHAARLARKASRLKESRTFRRSIRVEKTGRKADVQCIEVESATGLFLAGLGFVVTHNTKSEFASRLLPAWFLGRYPEKKIIQSSHTADLATSFGRKVRNLVATEKYQEIFPGTRLTADAKAAGRWATSAEGEYFAIGVGGKIAGYGADLMIVDDPHSEQDYIQALRGDTAVFDKAYEWFTSGPRQRLQPGGAIVIVMTRWHMRDLTGRIVRRMTGDKDVDNWEIIEFPALMPDTDNPLWPEYWPWETLNATREELPVAQWNAQYLQNPTAEEGAIIKREWWNTWEPRDPPSCEFVIQSWDTAFLKNERNDRSACTTWGVFYHPDEDGVEKANIILLDAFARRMEFPELKRVAFSEWKGRQPDAFIVEAKASGLPLIQELRAMGIPVQEYTPVRGSANSPNNKMARVNSISDIFSSGMVWCPDTRWAEEVREEFAAFPMGDHDDLVDSGTQALMRFRQGGFISLHSDEDHEPLYRESYSPY